MLLHFQFPYIKNNFHGRGKKKKKKDGISLMSWVVLKFATGGANKPAETMAQTANFRDDTDFRS